MQSTPNRAWRSIPTIEVNGATQMSIDRWLFDRHSLGYIPSTLRFYTWSPAVISLGYHQHHYPEHWQNLSWQDRPIDLIRRPTGGRGVLHQGDLSYSIVISGLSGKRGDIYRKISSFIIDGFQSLGVNLAYGNCQGKYIANPNCFALATGADLVCEDGYKLIGSAQLIRSGAILQHGSIRLNPDRDLFRKVFGSELPNPPPYIAKLSIAEIVAALTTAAAANFGVEFASIPLSDTEWQEIVAIDR
jgi:lipoate---protein ligase